MVFETYLHCIISNRKRRFDLYMLRMFVAEPMFRNNSDSSQIIACLYGISNCFPRSGSYRSIKNPSIFIIFSRILSRSKDGRLARAQRTNFVSEISAGSMSRNAIVPEERKQFPNISAPVTTKPPASFLSSLKL